ncbi:hypothetical protein TSOC_014528, partial [Tetrabaena socialis]
MRTADTTWSLTARRGATLERAAAAPCCCARTARWCAACASTWAIGSPTTRPSTRRSWRAC